MLNMGNEKFLDQERLKQDSDEYYQKVLKDKDDYYEKKCQSLESDRDEIILNYQEELKKFRRDLENTNEENSDKSMEI